MIRLACAAEGEAYVAHSAAMLHSVLEHADGVEVHYLHSPRFVWYDELTAMVDRGGGTIAFHQIADERVADLTVRTYFTSAMWFRILLPELLPDADRVLYLDADTIAVDDLGPLWEVDLGDRLVAAVENVFQRGDADHAAELGLRRYFNSGVLLLNLEEMRRARVTDALRNRGREHLAWPDQDALNLVLGQRRLALHPRWNAMNSILEWNSAIDVFGADAVREARERPGIRHFEGPSINKPWHDGCERTHRELYFRHRAATPWAEVRS